MNDQKICLGMSWLSICPPIHFTVVWDVGDSLCLLSSIVVRCIILLSITIPAIRNSGGLEDKGLEGKVIHRVVAFCPCETWGQHYQTSVHLSGMFVIFLATVSKRANKKQHIELSESVAVLPCCSLSPTPLWCYLSCNLHAPAGDVARCACSTCCTLSLDSDCDNYNYLYAFLPRLNKKVLSSLLLILGCLNYSVWYVEYSK